MQHVSGPFLRLLSVAPRSALNPRRWATSVSGWVVFYSLRGFSGAFGLANSLVNSGGWLLLERLGIPLHDQIIEMEK